MMKTDRRILGIDPSLLATGCAIIIERKEEKNLLHAAWIPTKRNKDVKITVDDMNRAYQIASTLLSLVSEYKIDTVFSEIPLGSKSARAAKSLSIAKGVVAAICACSKVNVQYVNPLRVKMTLCNNRSANKDDIIKAVEKQFSMMKHADRRVNRNGKFTSEHQAKCDAIAVVLALLKERNDDFNSNL